MNNELVAVGGLNQDPYNHSTMIGRLRRFYVHPNFRKYGIGSHLLKEIENFAKNTFWSCTYILIQMTQRSFILRMDMNTLPCIKQILGKSSTDMIKRTR